MILNLDINVCLAPVLSRGGHGALGGRADVEE